MGLLLCEISLGGLGVGLLGLLGGGRLSGVDWWRRKKKSRHLQSSVDSSRTDSTRSSPPLYLLVFRGFNVVPRRPLSRTRKQTSGLRIHCPLVLGGDTSNGLELRMGMVASRASQAWRYT